MSRDPRPWAPDPALEGQPRLFVAVPLPDAAVAEVEAVVRDVRQALDREAPARRSEVRWVRLEGVHLTLRFLGPTEPARVEDVAAAVAEAATAHVPFEVVVSGAGAFPSPLRPRTLWLGVEVGQDELARLARSVDDELARRGWPPGDREYRAHLTLARADGRREGPRAARLLAERARDLEVGFPIERVLLFESVTGGGPARYVPLHDAKLVPGGVR